MNKELKEQAHKEFYEEFDVIEDGFYSDPSNAKPYKVKSFLDSLIDKTVQQTEERIVGIIEKQRFIKTSNEGGVDFMIREAGNAIIDNIISLITNNSDINK